MQNIKRFLHLIQSMRKTVQIQKELKKGFPKFSFSEEQIQKIEAFLSLFHRWNQKMNLSSIRDIEGQFSKHIMDSCALILLDNLNIKGASLDLGSGGGLPGVLLAILYPELTVRSIDKVFKKITFQKNVMHQLELKNFHPEHVRLEDWADSEEHKQKYDFVFSRAMDQMEGMLNWADLLMHNNGKMILWKGKQWKEEWKLCSDSQKNNFNIEDFEYSFPTHRIGGHLLTISHQNT